MNCRNAALGMVVLWTVAGCSNPKALAPTPGRQPTSAAGVKVYQKQPARYENLGTVTVVTTNETRLDEKGDATAGFESLKAKAAALGANGLLLDPKVVEHEYLVTAGDHGTFYQVPARREPKAGVAQAIYVLEEK